MNTVDLSHPLVAMMHSLAKEKHAGQTRRGWAGDVPYFRHVEKVMLRAPKTPVDQAVAAGHDLVEDGRITLEELRLHLSRVAEPSAVEEVIDGIVTLSRQLDETYREFIMRVKNHRGGRWIRVKVADILSNLADVPTDGQIVRYSAALGVLLGP